MAGGYWARVKRVVEHADLVLEVIDCRFAFEARHAALEKRVTDLQKPLWLVFNKSDLVNDAFLSRIKRETQNEHRVFFVSAKEKDGIHELRHAILATAANKPVGIVGYPNSGKSSLINKIARRSAAPVSKTAGFTKGEQWVSASKIRLIDTPGVLPFEIPDEDTLALMGAKNAQSLSDPETAAAQCLKRAHELYGARVDAFYGVRLDLVPENEWIETIAKKRGRLQKGGLADAPAMARAIVRDWQTGAYAKT